MLQRLYVHNFRCLENFELNLKDMPSVLLIGSNGSGKSTIRDALKILQAISRSVNRVKSLVDVKDFARGRSDVPMRFEIEVLLGGRLFKYVLALELPERFNELRVAEEELLVDGNPVYSRQKAQVTLHYLDQTQTQTQTQFGVDWHLVALPIIQERPGSDSLHIFKTWLSSSIILAPIPALMTGISVSETLEPEQNGSNFSEWLAGLLKFYTAAYTDLAKYLGEVMADFRDIVNKPIGEDSMKTIVRFEERNANLSVYFNDLSDGEKCFFLCAVVLAANKFYGPLFCFWDEPDNYLSLSEVGHFVMALRRSFAGGSQILITTHNPEAIRRFSDENTFLLVRRSHLEPTVGRLLDELDVKGDLINALIRGDLDDGPK
ncbi:MAG: AAA family ATPase [Syntrophobacteraceae bacterium]|nr:AAA family ATPase [Syntrophobacteraceae bacterium]